MDEPTGVLIGFMVILSILVGVPTLTYHEGYSSAMKEAFDRGYAVQCVGKTGYYWECKK